MTISKDKMNNETELTNETIAEALGWLCFYRGPNYDYIGSVWTIPGIGGEKFTLPDFLNDLNASWKYVWPALRGLLLARPGSGYIYKYERTIIEAIESKNPALYLCEQFMKLKGD